jgi:hypothetical protein
MLKDLDTTVKRLSPFSSHVILDLHLSSMVGLPLQPGYPIVGTPRFSCVSWSFSSEDPYASVELWAAAGEAEMSQHYTMNQV